MASIRFEELVELIKSSPRYMAEWENGVPAEQSLYISFSEARPGSVTSNVFSTPIGKEVVFDVSAENCVAGIEIV